MNRQQTGTIVTATCPHQPYNDVIAKFFATSFPKTNTASCANLLEILTAVVIGTKNYRQGPQPSPESTVRMRQVIQKAMEEGTPIPIMAPWGSKKPSNQPFDIAELMGLQMLYNLNDRIVEHYSPGADIRVRVEDLSGYLMFEHEDGAPRKLADEYTNAMMQANFMLMTGFDHSPVEIVKESALGVTEDKLREFVYKVQPVIKRVLNGKLGFDNVGGYEELKAIGWVGDLPQNQIEFYLKRYAVIYPEMSVQGHADILSMYFACALARYKLGLLGGRSQWGRDYITVAFTPQVPETPAGVENGRLYYRTITANTTRNHLAPWRSHGFLRMVGNEAVPGLRSVREDTSDLEPNKIMLSRQDPHGGHREVTINAPFIIEA